MTDALKQYAQNIEAMATGVARLTKKVEAIAKTYDQTVAEFDFDWMERNPCLHTRTICSECHLEVWSLDGVILEHAHWASKFTVKCTGHGVPIWEWRKQRRHQRELARMAAE